MSWICQICGKKPSTGNTVVYRGLAKKKGGVGMKITGINRRWFKPNLQYLRAVVNGKPKRIRVCTRCISAGKVTKPVVKVKQTV